MAFSFDEVTEWVTGPLHAAGISDYSLWWIDVPEFLRNPGELYARLGGSHVPDAPAYEDIEPQLARIFEQYSTAHGIVLRHQRVLWQVSLPT